MIYVKAQHVLRLGGEIEPVSSVISEISDYLLKSRLAVAFSLLVLVDHESPEIIAVFLIFVFRVEREHAEAHEPVIGVDAEGTRYSGIFRIGLISLFEGSLIGGDEGLILTDRKCQYGISVFVVHRYQFYIHNEIFSLKKHLFILIETHGSGKRHKKTQFCSFRCGCQTAVTIYESYQINALQKDQVMPALPLMRSYSVQPMHTSLMIIVFFLSSFRQIHNKYTLKTA